MAVQAWTGLSILHGGLQVACNAKNFAAPTVEVVALDKTALCDTWQKFLGGKKSVTWNATLMQDHAEGGLDEVLHGLIGTTAPLSLLPAGSSYGSMGYAMSALELGYTPIQATHGELAMAEVSGVGDGVAVRGFCLHPPATARTSSANGTATQVGAVSATQRMFASLHVTTVSGTDTPTLTVKVQSAATEGGSYTDRITFSNATAVGGQWSNVAGAVTDTWWRVTWTISGTNPSFEFAVVAGVGALA